MPGHNNYKATIPKTKKHLNSNEKHLKKFAFIEFQK